MTYSPELAAILTEIEANDENYPVRYVLVLRALALAAQFDYPAGIGWATENAEAVRNGCRAVVYIELPGEEPGDPRRQVSWHMPEHPHAWDLHDTPTKYGRCRAYATRANL